MLAGARRARRRRSDRCATLRRAHDRLRRLQPRRARPRPDRHPRRPAQRRDRRPRGPRQDDARRRDAPPDRRPSAPTRPSSTGSWTRATSSARRASRSSPSRRPSITHGIRLNIVDTPGHADFGGEVERSLLMVDSVLLLVDAAEGPLPQTRYVLQKAMARHLPVVVGDQQDRPRRRPAGEVVLDDVYELFLDLGADEHQIEFPIVYTNAKAGTATRDLAVPGTDLRPLLDLLVEVTPPPIYTPEHPLQLLVTNLSANEYVGRMAVGRIWNGTIRTGQRITVVREEADDTAGAVEPGRTVTLERHGDEPADRARHRARGHRGGRPGRHRQRRRPARGHDRRHADRPGRSAAAAAPGRRRADAAHDVRREHLAARGPRGQVRHEPPDQGPPREARSSATSRSRSGRPSRARRSRSADAASSSSPSSSSRCAARASS